jgi:hypothetical protein
MLISRQATTPGPPIPKSGPGCSYRACLGGQQLAGLAWRMSWNQVIGSAGAADPDSLPRRLEQSRHRHGERLWGDGDQERQANGDARGELGGCEIHPWRLVMCLARSTEWQYLPKVPTHIVDADYQVPTLPTHAAHVPGDDGNPPSLPSTTT